MLSITSNLKWGTPGSPYRKQYNQQRILQGMIVSSRLKQPRNGKAKEDNGRKPPPLNFITNPPNPNDPDILKTMLATQKGQWLQDFSLEQQQMISEQFSKMMKTLRKKLVSPQGASHSQRNKVQAKTQRLQFSDIASPSKDTARKNVCTDRNSATLKSPKAKSSKQMRPGKVFSPNKPKSSKPVNKTNDRNKVASVCSPKKQRKEVRYIQASNAGARHEKLKSIKAKAVGSDQETYFLCGDTFVGVEQKQFKLFESEIFQSRVDRDEQLQFGWKQFLDEKVKLEKGRINSVECAESNKVFSEEENIIDFKNNSTKEESGIVSKNSITPEDRKIEGRLDKNRQAGKQIFEEFYGGALAAEIDNKQQTVEGNLPQHSNVVDYGEQQNEPKEEEVATQPPNYEEQSSIKVRMNAINMQLRTNKELLEKLYGSGKITQHQFQHHLDILIEKYDDQMTQIEKLKEAMDRNKQKIDMLLRSNKQAINISSRIDEVDPQNILEALVGERNLIPSTEDLNASLQQQDSGLQLSRESAGDCSEAQPVEDGRILGQIDNEKPAEQIGTFNQFAKELQQAKSNTKSLIEARIATQMGIGMPPPQGIKTSIASIFQFAKLFFNFLKTYHLEEFLAYVNMPYGYSVEQRLRYMQGYDDAEDQQQVPNGVIYGLEQVVRPEILEQFHEKVYFRHYSQCMGLDKECEKLHQRAILDCINESINRFRPYFIISGLPYPWTTCEKALTYYLIEEDCIEQLLEKVQFQVLKCSSALCGLIVPEATHQQPALAESELNIEKIFEKYTIETECQLLEHREAKVMKQQKIEADETNFEWQFHDEFKTAILFEISSTILEQLAAELGEVYQAKRANLYVQQLYEECHEYQNEADSFQF